MNAYNLAVLIGVFALSFGVGYGLILRVPPQLHTPLMSMTNAISAVTILGGILLFTAKMSWVGIGLGMLAVALAAFNLAGGFAITDHMLRLFQKKDRVL